ncbi:MAG: rhodanese-like domain-containing protein [Candidatus Hydrogenedentes bacterium]|nr:rhodanese-like domain-containing protein [Candidatus Hydrogenedentota bacterium]
MNTISPESLNEKKAAGEALVLIDVRTPAEFGEVHVPFAVNVPLDRITPESVREAANGAPVYVICRSGQRAKNACEQLARSGVDNLTLVEGGTQGWVDAGLEAVRGKKAISLERQVRIAAGALVVLGSALAWFVHPAWLALPAFVGTGLVFAGVTDTCGMAMILARMPWNRGSA